MAINLIFGYQILQIKRIAQRISSISKKENDSHLMNYYFFARGDIANELTFHWLDRGKK